MKFVLIALVAILVSANQAVSWKGADYDRSDYELLPDLVPIPAQDVVLEELDGIVRLLFTTMYFNQGRGPLELRADPKTAGIKADLERTVLQRIFQPDETYREVPVGNFMWHQEHLHYHFADFVIYDLEAIDVEGPPPDLSGVRVKRTFCIRDVSLVDMETAYRPEDAGYLICGKELQGITVGWADTYFYNYPDQSLDITDLPSGTYKLSFHVNPENILEEISYDNNKASVVIELDMDSQTVKVLESSPAEFPSVEHVYPEQIFNNPTQHAL